MMTINERIWDQASAEQALANFQPTFEELNAKEVWANLGEKDAGGLPGFPDVFKFPHRLSLVFFFKDGNDTIRNISRLYSKREEWRKITDPKWVEAIGFVLPIEGLNTVAEVMREFHMDQGTHKQVYPPQQPT